jgi:predicted benzoate:H+ symporter BenE
MTIIGVILTLVGFGAALAMFTGVAGAFSLTLAKIPLGITGWVIVGGVGITLVYLYRRPAD